MSEERPETKVCRTCGRTVDAHDVFCRYCGSPVTDEVEAEGAEQPVSDELSGSSAEHPTRRIESVAAESEESDEPGAIPVPPARSELETGSDEDRGPSLPWEPEVTSEPASSGRAAADHGEHVEPATWQSQPFSESASRTSHGANNRVWWIVGGLVLLFLLICCCLLTAIAFTASTDSALHRELENTLLIAATVI